MSIVGGAVCLCPVFHAFRYLVGNFHVYRSAFLYGIDYSFECFIGKVFLHFLLVEYIYPIVVGEFFFGCLYVYRFPVGQFL